VGSAGQKAGTPFGARKAGDLEAFDELMVEFGPLVLRTAFRVLGRRDLAEDAAQETFLKLHSCLTVRRIAANLRVALIE